MKTNDQILKERINKYNKRDAAKVGEYLYYKGAYVRFTHDWGDSLQTGEGGSFYLGHGYMDYSGSLNRGIDKKNLVLTKRLRPGYVWFFKNDIHTGHNGIDFKVPLRVWKVKKGIKIEDYDILGRDLCPKCKGLNFLFNVIGKYTHTCKDCGYTN